MKDKNSTLKFAAVGGSTCLMLGSAAAISALNDINDESLSFDADERLTLAEVDDSMTLEEALESAREQTGSDGVFVHEGIAYATVTAEEWAEKSPAIRQAVERLAAPDHSDTEVEIAADDFISVEADDVVHDTATLDDDPQYVALEQPKAEDDDDEADIETGGEEDEEELILLDDEEDFDDDLTAKGDGDEFEPDTMPAFVSDADVSIFEP